MVSCKIQATSISELGMIALLAEQIWYRFTCSYESAVINLYEPKECSVQHTSKPKKIFHWVSQLQITTSWLGRIALQTWTCQKSSTLVTPQRHCTGKRVSIILNNWTLAVLAYIVDLARACWRLLHSVVVSPAVDHCLALGLAAESAEPAVNWPAQGRHHLPAPTSAENSSASDQLERSWCSVISYVY